MSQAALGTPAAIALKEYFGLESDDSDESVVGSPEHKSQDEVADADIVERRSSKSSSGVSDSSFSSNDSSNGTLSPIVRVTSKLQRRPPAQRISLSEGNFEIVAREPLIIGDNFVEGEDDAHDDFLDGSQDEEGEEEGVVANLDETKDMDEEDLGFHEVSPLKRERIEAAADQSDSSMGVSPKRPRIEPKQQHHQQPEEIVEEELVVEDPRDSSARSDGSSEGGDGLSSFIVLREPSGGKDTTLLIHQASESQKLQLSRQLQQQPYRRDEDDDEEEAGTFDVAGVQWNFSSRCAEYLTSAVFVNDIYRVICARESGCGVEEISIRPADIDVRLKREFIEMLLTRKAQLKLTLTSVHLALRLFDLFLAEHSCDRAAFIGVAVVAVVLASKMEEYESCRFSAVARVLFPFEEELEVPALKALEKSFYYQFNYSIDVPTAFLVANIFHTMVVSTKQQVHLANYLLELTLFDWSLAQHRPTVVAHAAVALAHALAREEDKWRSDVDSLLSVERRLSHFSGIHDTRAVAARMIKMFEQAAHDTVSVYDRYSTEAELYVAFFEVTVPLKAALAAPSRTQ